MTMMMKYYKILGIWMSYGQTFEQAIENLENTDKHSKLYAELFKKHRNWTLTELEEKYPEYCL